MDANEILVWGVLVCLIAIEVAGIAHMIVWRPAPVQQTDFDVSDADLVELRAKSANR
jgi:hypothetical protein